METGGRKPSGKLSQWSGAVGEQRQALDQGRAEGQREGGVFRKLRVLVSGSSRFYS